MRFLANGRPWTADEFRQHIDAAVSLVKEAAPHVDRGEVEQRLLSQLLLIVPSLGRA